MSQVMIASPYLYLYRPVTRCSLALSLSMHSLEQLELRIS